MDRPPPRRPGSTTWRSIPDGAPLRWSGPLSPPDHYPAPAAGWETDLAASPPRAVIRNIGPEEKIFWLFGAIGEPGDTFLARIWGIDEPFDPGCYRNDPPRPGRFLVELRLTLDGKAVPDGFARIPPGTRFAHHAELLSDQVPFPGAQLIFGGINAIQLCFDADECSAFILEMGPDPAAAKLDTFSALWRAFWRPPPPTNAEIARQNKESQEAFERLLSGGDDPDAPDPADEWKLGPTGEDDPEESA